ncbi:e36562f9-003d-49ac-b33d-270b4734531d [Sclerotinia trifoliorum]|uniref:E36562f9-003d-49ac-b33d-270b4734531d n=1 Tax=Sclerotinia trifoliorum TaxID=28548 RepID=A0A8H2VRA6_9HELO|nr:e36562f9-003d-49ac-b33d-270b4734531d [Sclerotinia trifoliorum]
MARRAINGFIDAVVEGPVEGSIDKYPLERDFQASTRLYLQHYIWKRQLGHLLQPCIPLTKNIKVADVACGTGIWLIDLAKELAKNYPSAQLQGFDISTAQFPPKGWLPKNVILDTLDILKPIPDSLREQFDVVHTGYLCLVVENGDPFPILDNLLALLKPGGYLQWDDGDFGGIYAQSTDPGVPKSALDELKNQAQSLVSGKYNDFRWITELDKTFQKRNLVVLANQYVPIDDEIAHPWTMTHLMASVEMGTIIERERGNAEEWWNMHRCAIAEMYHGASLRMSMVSIAGRKPKA